MTDARTTRWLDDGSEPALVYELEENRARYTCPGCKVDKTMVSYRDDQRMCCQCVRRHASPWQYRSVCPKCGAAKGKPCRSSNRKTHAARFRARRCA